MIIAITPNIIRVRGVKRPARRMRSLGALALGAARVAVSVSISVPGGWVAAGPRGRGTLNAQNLNFVNENVHRFGTNLQFIAPI